MNKVKYALGSIIILLAGAVFGSDRTSLNSLEFKADIKNIKEVKATVATNCTGSDCTMLK